MRGVYSNVLFCLNSSADYIIHYKYCRHQRYVCVLVCYLSEFFGSAVGGLETLHGFKLQQWNSHKSSSSD